MQTFFSAPFDLQGLGGRLRAQRIALGLLQREIALAAGCTKLTQLNYENGSQIPSLNYLNEVAKIVVDVHYVLTGKLT